MHLCIFVLFFVLFLTFIFEWDRARVEGAKGGHKKKKKPESAMHAFIMSFAKLSIGPSV